MKEIQLRDYQQECIETIQAQKPGSYLIQMATGLGKTVTFANIPRQGRVLLLSHREELVEQPRKYYDCSYGVERAASHSNGEEVVSASVQTMVRRLNRFSPTDFDMIITDECFPAGTLVDKKPIEQIAVGDMVTAYNHGTGQTEKRRVTHVFKRPAPDKMVKINGDLICTPNHPVYAVDKGRYVNAEEIAPGDSILCRVWKNNSLGEPYKRAEGQLPQVRESVLFDGMQQGVLPPHFIGDNGTDKSKICVRAHESQQPHEPTGNPGENDKIHTPHRIQAESERREWNGADGAASAFDGNPCNSETHRGVCCQDGSKKKQQPERLPSVLQNRHCDSSAYAGNRSGREQPLCIGKASAGREESEFLEVRWVESVEVFQQGSDGGPGGVCKDGYVYNLEVDGLNNYFANGVLVHNCHHSAATTYRKIYQHFKPRLHLGFTATPNRGDRVRLDDIYSDIIFQRDLRWAIKNGYLTDIYCRRVNIGYDLSQVHTRAGDYAPGELDKAMDGTADAIAQAYRELATGATLIFAVSVQHAKNIAEKIPGAVVVTGETKDRASIIRDFIDGKIPCIVNVMVFTEGTDIPRVETIINARPTQSESLFCLDEETEILTKNGWKKDVRIGERVAAYDTESREIRFVPAIAKVRRRLEAGEYFCSISGPCCDIRVTNNHRVLYRNRRDKDWKIKTADEVADRKGGSYIPVAGHTGFSGLPLTDDEIRFIAWVMTDGCINKCNNCISITQSTTQPYVEEIQRVIESCGFKYGRHIANSKTQFNRNGDNIIWTISHGKPRGRDKDKKGWACLEAYISKDFAPILHEMSERQFDILLETCHFADGHKQNARDWVQRSYHISKGNKKFIENLQIAGIMRGWKANLSTRENNNGNPIYTLHLKKQDYINVGQTSDGRPMWVKEPHKDEFCWCVQNELGTLVTRRNGKVAITGNCQMVGRGLRLYPGKEKLNLIDCVGTTGRASLCTAPTLLGIDMSLVPEEKREEIEGDLFELPELIERAADCPQSWIKNIQIVDLWAKENQYDTRGINFFKMPDDRLVVSLKNNQKMIIPAPDALGQITCKDGRKITTQEAIDCVYKRLLSLYPDERYIWDTTEVKKWGNAPASEAQMNMIRRRLKDKTPQELTKGQASQILNRLFADR